MGQGLLIHEFSGSHTSTQHSPYDSSRRVISSSQRPLPDNTQHSKQRHPCPGGIRNHNLSRRGSTVLRLRPRGHCDWRAGVLDVCKHKGRRLHVCYNVCCAATLLDGNIILSYCSMLKPASPESHWSWQRHIARNDGGHNVVLLSSVATSACCENKSFGALALLTANC